jgi:hypothetical protein
MVLVGAIIGWIALSRSRRRLGGDDRLGDTARPNLLDQHLPRGITGIFSSSAQSWASSVVRTGMTSGSSRLAPVLQADDRQSRAVPHRIGLMIFAAVHPRAFRWSRF